MATKRGRVAALWAVGVLVLGMMGACRRGATLAEAQAGATPAKTAAAASAGSEEFWYGVYLQSQKIGYLQETLRPDPAHPGQFEYANSDLVDLNLMGQPLRQSTLTKVICDAAYAPIEMHFALTSSGRSTTVKAQFGADKVTYQRVGGDAEGKGGDANSGTVPIPAGTKLVADARLVLAHRKLKPGDKLTFHTFNPVTLSIDENELSCDRTEPLALVGENIDATVVTVKTKFGTMTSWVDATGRPRQTEVAMMQAKLSYRDEPKEQALSLDKGGQRVDLATATAIHPDKPIPNPREVRHLRLRVKGLALLSAVPNDGSQQIKDLGDGWREVTVTAPPPAQATPPTEVEKKTFLRATSYIQAEHPDLVAAAKEAVGTAQNPADRAHAIQLYVRGRVKWQSNVGMFRSALEVFRDPNGVCRDAAALYTALARAAGLPTRVCGGLIYLNDSFLGHAWAETWVGDRWQPVDATLSQQVADAARLKLAQGDDYTALFEMLPALGNLTVEVLEVKGP
ncbi:MAG: transglutaminase domain-containing protein [Armatimonadetes bacterium]|nr:transglutaminase domain-containing protein [Armatimonadota bacterium]